MSLSEPTDPTDASGRLNYACQLGHTSFVENVVRECGVKVWLVRFLLSFVSLCICNLRLNHLFFVFTEL